jgi:transcriptional pleiotropic regulator of transition state genes
MINGGPLLDTLIVRKIDDLGRIVVPAETRRLFNIHEGDELAITVENSGIVLRKLEATCIFCEGTNDLRNYHGRGVCVDCRSNLADA